MDTKQICYIQETISMGQENRKLEFNKALGKVEENGNGLIENGNSLQHT